MSIDSSTQTVDTTLPTLYVSDLDGTLLGHDSMVSAASVAMLNRLIDERGILFTVATARTPATVEPIMQQVHMRLPLITMTGAALWDAASHRFAGTQILAPDVVDGVLQVLAEEGLQPFVYRRCGERLEAHHAGVLTTAESHFVEERKHLILKSFVLGNEARLFSGDSDTLLIFVMNDYARLERAHRLITTTMPCTAMLYRDIFDPATGLLEVYRQGCTKARAIAELAQQCGAGRVVTFGDNLNDLDMLRHADVAVAVANAVPEVKAIANIIIGTNTADAVPKFIMHEECLA